MAASETGSVGLIDRVTNISDFIWAGTWNGAEVLPFPPMTIILLGVGLWMMIGLKFYPLRKLGSAFSGLFAGRKSAGAGEISPFAALSTALSGQVGTGNLAGVATAITGSPVSVVKVVLEVATFPARSAMVRVRVCDPSPRPLTTPKAVSTSNKRETGEPSTVATKESRFSS